MPTTSNIQFQKSEKLIWNQPNINLIKDVSYYSYFIYFILDYEVDMLESILTPELENPFEASSLTSLYFPN